MSTPHPFLLVPWQDDFMVALARLLLRLEREEGTPPGKVTLVFPHSRPARYLRETLSADPAFHKPLLLPRCLSVRELVGLIRLESSSTQPRSIGLLDQIGLLHQVLEQLRREAPTFSPLPSLPLEDFGLFLPWGMRLANLLEECWLQNQEPENYQYLEDEVQPYGAALLASLRAIQNAYSRALRENNWTTPGFDAINAARLMQNNQDSLDYAPTLEESSLNSGVNSGVWPRLKEMFTERQIIIAGFYQLDESEEVIFQRLWEDCGALVCLHTSQSLLDGKAHPACAEHAAWIKRWGAQLALLDPESNLSQTLPEPEVRIWEGYDLHSELEALRHELAESAQADKKTGVKKSTAVILPDTSLLMPTLHSLPDKEVNVSMGYPLEFSALTRLLEILMRLRENCRIVEDLTPHKLSSEQPLNEHYYWKDLLELYRHPLLRSLNGPGNIPLGPLLRELEKALLDGPPYCAPKSLLSQALAGQQPNYPPNYPLGWPPEQQNLLATLNKVCITNFATLGSAADLALALSAFTGLLREWGREMWESFPIDAECLYRLVQKIIPQFAHSVLKDKPLPEKALFGLLRGLLAQERVPFEGEPLGALQVIGFLESRLLTFKRVFILEATEDNLPGAPANDPLLPETLRNEMGLSTLRRRENSMAHNFWRLAAGAEELVLLTRSTQDSSGLLDERKVRSRFVEELIWQAEQKKRALLKPVTSVRQGDLHFKQDGPLRVVLGKVEKNSDAPQSLAKTPELLGVFFERMRRGGLSATFLDAYLSCPFRFALEKLCSLRPSEGIKEDDDPAAVGELLHATLHDFFKPYLNKTIYRENLDPTLLKHLFLQGLEEKKAELHLPADSWLMLRKTGPERLRRMLENSPPETEILHLEHPLRAELCVDFSQELDALNNLPAPSVWSAGVSGLLSKIAGPNNGQINFTFYGKIDRIDRRGDELWVLDYKSGRIPDSKLKTWEDEALWCDLHDWHPTWASSSNTISTYDQDVAELELFENIAAGLDSLQMPLYLYLARQHALDTQQAVWVELAESGWEKSLFGAKISEETRTKALKEYIPDLLTFVLRHLLLTPTFFPRQSQACRWCSFVSLCKVKT